MVAARNRKVERVVVLLSRFTGQPVAYTNLDPPMEAIVERVVADGDYVVLYDGPPNWGKHGPN